MNEPLTLAPANTVAHQRAVQVHTAETILTKDQDTLYPMAVDIRLCLADGSKTPWVRTVVDAPNERVEFDYNVHAKCTIVGYDYIPHFAKHNSLTPRHLLPGDIYNFKWAFTIDMP